MANKANLRICFVSSILLLLTLCTAAVGKTIYVDDDASGANDGTSWANAYVYLQDALADANEAEKPVEIRVAQGTYTPDQDKNHTRGDPVAIFQLINGVTLNGGYAGFDEPDPNARDISLLETILSGDLNGNDVGDKWNQSRDENSYHVVTGSGTDKTALLDGFTITSGFAIGEMSFFGGDGGGMVIMSGSPTLRNCTFTDCLGFLGGAIYNEDSRATIINCTFSDNHAFNGAGIYSIESDLTLAECVFRENFQTREYWWIDIFFYEGGGGLYNKSSHPKLTDCVFVGNSAEQGGGLFNNHSNPLLVNCTFTGNWSYNFFVSYGGGMFNIDSSPILTKCTFSRNFAGDSGGGITNGESSVTLTNCIFSGNSAGFSGGGISNAESRAILINCTLTQNIAENGNALACDSHKQKYPSDVELINCIICGGGGGTWNNDGSSVKITYSNIQEGQAGIHDPCDVVIWGVGNIDADPLFADPGYWADVNDPNIVVEPNGPNAVWVDGDYHLKSEAGRWDPVSESWVIDDVTSPCIDAGDPNSDWTAELWPHGERINMGAYGGTSEASMSLSDAGAVVYIQWLGHSSVKIWTEDCVVYVDPERLTESLHDATIVCVSHTHGDHYSPSDIASVSNSETLFIGPPDVVQQYGSGEAIAPGQTIEFDNVNIIAVPSYNTNKPNHPKSRSWVGFIIGLGSKRIYVAGDTDLIEEMNTLGDIDVAILPAGGTYTMNAVEAAEATQYIQPELAIPYHWGQSVGTLSDAETFAELAACAVKILTVGETISSEDWPEYSPLIAHWKLDETEGGIAYDSAGDNDGTCHNEPLWQPASGKVNGAIQFDGIDDYISTDFVLNPAEGAFSVFAWVQGGTAGQVIISQTNGTGTGETWIGAETSDGKLMTGLVPPAVGRSAPQPLVSESVITDGQWHHIGLVWDRSYRYLYVDGIEAAGDTKAQAPLKASDGGLYIGAGETFGGSSFFWGLIDDVRIYNRTLSAEDIEELAR